MTAPSAMRCAVRLASTRPRLCAATRLAAADSYSLAPQLLGPSIGLSPSQTSQRGLFWSSAPLRPPQRQPATRPSPGPPKDDHDGRHRRQLTLLASFGLFSFLFAVSQPQSKDELERDGQPKATPATPPPATTTETTTETTSTEAQDSRDPSLPRYRLADIRKNHGPRSDTPWVTSGDKVYDITDWVAAHPGGDVILRAAGGSIDPYWAIFTIHKAPHVREILAQYQIGLVDGADLVDGQPAAELVEDPFAQDPARDARLQTHTARPRNAEPPRSELARDFVTPNELFYVRNHMWVPVVGAENGREGLDTDMAAAADGHQLAVELPDGDVRTYTVAELRRRFRTHRVTAVLQCSGNRRSDMTRSVGKTNGLQWGVGAISNAVWEGVLLRDVLADAGLRVKHSLSDSPSGSPCDSETDNADNSDNSDDSNTVTAVNDMHVQMAGLEAYAASIPLATALDPRGDVLLAYGMNGQPLPRDHGFPLRAVVPGHVAARSVKWLSRVVVADEESTSQWQRRDYKLFGPNEGAAPDWDRYPAIQEMPITSAITNIWLGDEGRRLAQKWAGLVASSQASVPQLPHQDRAAPGVRDLRAWQAANLPPASPAPSPAEHVAVTGYAYSGGGRQIVRVDVSLDGGRTWDQAELLDRGPNSARDGGPSGDRMSVMAGGGRDWAWTRWRYAGQVYDGKMTSDKDNKGDKDDKDDKNKPAAEIVVKAIDSAYNTQPERHDAIYNVRGNLATAWHRVQLCRKAGTLTGCGFN